MPWKTRLCRDSALTSAPRKMPGMAGLHLLRYAATRCLARSSSNAFADGTRAFAFGRSPPQLPVRETWFCLYQPQPGRTAYLYEHDQPITDEVFRLQVSPLLRQHLSRPPEQCFIRRIDSELFTNCDVAAPPWYCYQVQLMGERVGQRYGPYEANDIVAPNRVVLPNQNRTRQDVRDARDILLFLAVPSAARLESALATLVRVAIEDDWRGPAVAVYGLMKARWGAAALEQHGVTLSAVVQRCQLYKRNMQADTEGG